MTGQPDGPGAMLAFAFYLAFAGFLLCLVSCAISRIVDHFRDVNRIVRDMPLPPEPTAHRSLTASVPQPRQETHIR